MLLAAPAIRLRGSVALYPDDLLSCRGVMAAIQAFRHKVRAVGNLETDDTQIVVMENEAVCDCRLPAWPAARCGSRP
jgi:hypothetical protein